MALSCPVVEMEITMTANRETTMTANREMTMTANIAEDIKMTMIV